MVNDLNNLFRLSRDHIKQASDVLDRAFEDFPMHVAFIPDKSERKKKSRYFLEFFIRYGILYGEVYATSPKLEGVSIWLPSKRSNFTMREMLRSGILFYVFKLGIKTILRMISIGNHITSIHKRYAPFPHIHGFYIGVDPEFQGKGYGSTLHRALLARADKAKLPCYIETQKETNVTLWKRYGFHVVSETVIPGTEFKHWAMLRDKVSQS